MTLKACVVHGMAICPKCGRCCMDGDKRCMCYLEIMEGKPKQEQYAIISYIELWKENRKNNRRLSYGVR